MEPAKLLHTWKECLSNNGKAQSELYQYFAPKMYAVCLRFAENAESAQDILQNGFIKVFSKGQNFEGKGSLEGWIRKVMLNSAIEYYRKNKVVFQTTDSISEDHHELPADFDMHGLGYKDLLNMIKELPIGYRTVFNLYAIEGYNHKEIAEMLDMSEGTSKSQLSRARQWLKEKLKKMEENIHEGSRI